MLVECVRLNRLPLSGMNQLGVANQTLVNVGEKDGWIRIKSGELNFLGKSNTFRQNAFKVAFSDRHDVRDATGTIVAMI